MCALYRYQQTFLICGQKTVGAVRYASMPLGVSIITVDRLLDIFEAKQLRLFGFFVRAFLLNTVQFNYATTMYVSMIFGRQISINNKKSQTA